ncbi:hypothetical protein GQX74_007632 [Glossina fuscipes]|nr:hypothetical protein GQX74_007632 [Glossina fuscipes]
MAPQRVKFGQSMLLWLKQGTIHDESSQIEHRIEYLFDFFRISLLEEREHFCAGLVFENVLGTTQVIEKFVKPPYNLMSLDRAAFCVGYTISRFSGLQYDYVLENNINGVLSLKIVYVILMISSAQVLFVFTYKISIMRREQQHIQTIRFDLSSTFASSTDRWQVDLGSIASLAGQARAKLQTVLPLKIDKKDSPNDYIPISPISAPCTRMDNELSPILNSTGRRDVI